VDIVGGLFQDTIIGTILDTIQTVINEGIDVCENIFPKNAFRGQIHGKNTVADGQTAVWPFSG
jgi:hypothetical protein